MDKLAHLRHQYAKIKGYENHFARVIKETSLVKSPNEVEKLCEVVFKYSTHTLVFSVEPYWMYRDAA